MRSWAAPTPRDAAAGDQQTQAMTAYVSPRRVLPGYLGKSEMTKRLDYNRAVPRRSAESISYIMQSGLPAELVELVYLRVSQINSCAYWLDMHTRDLTKTGFPIEKLALVQAFDERGDLFTDTERAALAWAETVTRVAQTDVPDEAYQAALAVFGEKELVDLTIAISLMNAYNRMAISFRNTPQAAIKN
jgi:AhpD family alkylhydroperoxidase